MLVTNITFYWQFYIYLELNTWCAWMLLSSFQHHFYFCMIYDTKKVSLNQAIIQSKRWHYPPRMKPLWNWTIASGWNVQWLQSAVEKICKEICTGFLILSLFHQLLMSQTTPLLLIAMAVYSILYTVEAGPASIHGSCMRSKQLK